VGGFFGIASKGDCVGDLFYGTDYHSHLGTKRGGLAVHGRDGFARVIHSIENDQFRSKFDPEVAKLEGRSGIASSATPTASRSSSNRTWAGSPS
jgi:amidophosphoribosyltransferase